MNRKSKKGCTRKENPRPGWFSSAFFCASVILTIQAWNFWPIMAYYQKQSNKYGDSFESAPIKPNCKGVKDEECKNTCHIAGNYPAIEYRPWPGLENPRSTEGQGYLLCPVHCPQQHNEDDGAALSAKRWWGQECPAPSQERLEMEANS